MKKLKNLILYTTLILTIFTSFGFKPLQAQEEHNPVNDVYIVLGASLVGAILGLSTLSFVKDPGDRFATHVGYGLSIGIIGGVVAVVSGQAARAKSLYEKTADYNKEFSSRDRYSWHDGHQNSFIQNKTPSLFLTHSFKF